MGRFNIITITHPNVLIVPWAMHSSGVKQFIVALNHERNVVADSIISVFCFLRHLFLYISSLPRIVRKIRDHIILTWLLSKIVVYTGIVLIGAGVLISIDLSIKIALEQGKEFQIAHFVRRKMWKKGWFVMPTSHFSKDKKIDSQGSWDLHEKSRLL